VLAVIKVSTSSHSNVSRSPDTIENNVNIRNIFGSKTSWITAFALILVSFTISPAFARCGGSGAGGGRGGFGGGGSDYRGGGGGGGYRNPLYYDPTSGQHIYYPVTK
jgi:hypothetical protein